MILDIGGIDNNKEVYNDSSEKFKELDEIVEELKEVKGVTVVVKGGEPTLHPNFFEIIELLRTKLCKIIVLTNGRAFSYEDYCKRFLDDVLFIVKVWGKEEMHDSLTKVKGSFNQTMDGIDNLIKLGKQVEVIIPLIRKNLPMVPELYEMLRFRDLFGIRLWKLDSKYLEEEGIDSAKDIVKECYSKDPYLLSLENFFVDGINKVDTTVYPVVVEPKVLKEFVQAAINEVHKHSLIFISVDEVYRLLKKIKEKEKFWDFVYEIGYPIPIVSLLLQELKKLKVVRIENDSVYLNFEFKQLNNMKDYSLQRLESDPKVCQLTVAQESLGKRIGYISECCISGGRAAVLGDDDFVSLSLASVGLFDEIVVFEIDKRIVKKIKEISDKEGYNITVIEQDFRKELPNKYKKKFDMFYTDSPYSANGFKLFISRGVSLLRERQKCHGFSSFSCEMPIIDEIELPVQGIINDMNLFVETKWWGGLNNVPDSLKGRYGSIDELHTKLFSGEKFEKLDEWLLAALGRKEFMFHFLTSTKSKPGVKGEFTEEIYYEDKPLEFYTDLAFIAKSKKNFREFNF